MYDNVAEWFKFNINARSFLQAYGSISSKLYYQMTMLLDDSFAM